MKHIKMSGKTSTTAKYTLVAINIVLVITGIIIIAVGLSVQSAYKEYSELIPKIPIIKLPILCIANGGIIFLIAVIGFYAAYSENVNVQSMFVAAMIVMIVFPLAACIAAFASQDIVTSVQEQLALTMNVYGSRFSDFKVTVQWDQLQQNFECCGTANSSDWLSPLSTQETLGVPVSCCGHVYGAVHIFQCTVSTAFSSGCAEQLGNFVNSQIRTIGVAGLLMTLMQVVIIVGLVLWLAKIARGEREGYWLNKTGKAGIINAQSTVVKE